MVKVAYVCWDDASGISGPLSVEEAARQVPIPVRSAGILVGEDEDCVRLAQDYYTRPMDGMVEVRVRDLAVIPRKFITKMKTWEVK